MNACGETERRVESNLSALISAQCINKCVKVQGRNLQPKGAVLRT